MVRTQSSRSRRHSRAHAESSTDSWLSRRARVVSAAPRAESARSAASARLAGGMAFDTGRAAELLATSGVGDAGELVLAASDRIVDRAVARFVAVRDAPTRGGTA